MEIAYHPDDLLNSLIELRPGDARKRFRKAIFDDYPLRGPLGHCCCAYCGKWNEKLTLDHVIPKSKGGPHYARYNLVPACNRCNVIKASDDVLEFWRPQEWWSKEREDILFRWMMVNSWLAGRIVEADCLPPAEPLIINPPDYQLDVPETIAPSLHPPEIYLSATSEEDTSGLDHEEMLLDYWGLQQWHPQW